MSLMGKEASIIGISRHRLGSDGHGVTTLVAFHGCPLRCKYCLNNQCWEPEGISRKLTARELYDEVQKDELYFIATEGGLTFGGGEPLLHADFIKEVLELGAKHWNVTIETSLNVQRENIETILPYVNDYIIDVKDMNPAIYKAYTGKDNARMIDNLKWLVANAGDAQIHARLPLIEGFNTKEDVDASAKALDALGISFVERFKYISDVDKFKSNIKKL